MACGFCSQHPHVLPSSLEPQQLLGGGNMRGERDRLHLKATTQLDLMPLTSQEVPVTALLLHLSVKTDRSKCHH